MAIKRGILQNVECHLEERDVNENLISYRSVLCNTNVPVVHFPIFLYLQYIMEVLKTFFFD